MRSPQMSGFSRRGLTLLLAGIVAAGVALGIVIPLGTGGPGGRAALNAFPIDPPRPAPPTLGSDSDGVEVRLPSTESRPALVTFLFTQCPDVCPLLATQIASALDMAGESARGIDVIAISVDPEDDTPEAVNDFLARYDLQGRMRYLIGTRAELTPVWDAWQIAPQPVDDGHGHEGEEESVHSAPLILVDESGRQVAKYSPGIPFEAADLASDIRALS